MAMLMMNSYNTGATNIGKFLPDFLKNYPNQQAIAEAYGEKYDGDMGDDVFVYMTKYGQSHEDTRKSYGKDSSQYVQKSEGMTKAMENPEPKIEEYKPRNEATGSRFFNVAGKLQWLKNKIFGKEKSAQKTEIIERMQPEDFYKKAPVLAVKSLHGKYASTDEVEILKIPKGKEVQYQARIANDWVESHKEYFDNFEPAKNKKEII